MKETHQSVILQHLAQEIRKETGIQGIAYEWRKHSQRCANLYGYLAPGQSVSVQTSMTTIFPGTFAEVLFTEPIALSINKHKRVNWHAGMSRWSNATFPAALDVLDVGHSVLLDQVTVCLSVLFYSLWYFVLFHLFSRHYMGLTVAKAEWYTPPLCEQLLPPALLTISNVHLVLALS